MARHLAVAFLLAAALAGAAVGAAECSRPPRLTIEGPVWRYREGDLLYRFHATFRVERLFDAKEDPYETRDLSTTRPADLIALRAAVRPRRPNPHHPTGPTTGGGGGNDAPGRGGP